MKALYLFGILAASLALTDGVMFCYYESWAAYAPYGGEFHTNDIDPHLCTHLFYAFAGINPETYEVKILDPYTDLCIEGGLCGFENFTALKQENPDLKTLLSIGGWTEGSETYSTMAGDKGYREAFVASSVSLIQQYGFDGLDLDWEYPTQRGGVPEDKENFVTLLNELKAGLQEDGLLLTIAVSAGKYTIDESYDIPGISAVVDFVNLMTYDFHGSWEPFTHANSPLFAHPDDADHGLEFLNVDFAVQYWIDGGCPPVKLVMGIPVYGRTYTLEDPSQTGFFAPTSLPGIPGVYTNESGLMGYHELCFSQILSDEWVIVHDETMNEPYAYILSQNNLWVSYDDPDSVRLKAAYARDQGLAGCMVWSMDTDDFAGACGRPYDIINSITEEFHLKK
ncbi:unnamed protein product [Meganyctiphanes norvegica]|uniref:GH18 domain-containing protein n=1 Tax=Meganyctiphanes norvegica TaxID=48144 RepID=A0AAV2R542_MEGNR